MIATVVINFFLIFRRPLSSTLFPYTTLFRSVCPRTFGTTHRGGPGGAGGGGAGGGGDRKSTRLNSSHVAISYAVFCLKKKRSFGRRETHPSSAKEYRYGHGVGTLNGCEGRRD